MHNNGFKTVLITILFLVLIPVTAAASGTREDRLDEAEILIDAREYNEALLVLTDILKKDPERLDDVQGLLERIRVEKELYNDKYEELLETYGGDEVEAAYPIIKELEEMDPNPNEATRISLVLARETAGFVFNNNRWVDIMERASERILAEEYAESVQIYTEGFDLSRDIFLDSGYGNVVVNEINSRAGDMAELSTELIDLFPVLKNQQTALSSVFELRNLNEYVDSLDSFYPDMERAVEIREELKDTADYFIVQEQNIRRNSGDNKEVHYLIYMDRLLNGRTTVDELEGITGSIELYWNSLYSDIAGNNYQLSADYYDRALGEYRAGSLNAAESIFREAITAASNASRLITFGEQYFESDSQFERPGMLLYDRDELQKEAFIITQRHDTSESFLTVIDEERKVAEILNRIQTAEQSETLPDEGPLLKTELQTEAGIVEDLFNSSEDRLEQVKATAGEDEEYAEAVESASLPSEEYRLLAGRLLEAEINLSAGIFNIDLQQLQSDYLAAEADVEEGTALIEGVADEAGQPVEGEEFTVTYKYPDQALQQLLAVERSVNTLIENLDSLDERILAERPGIRSGEPVAAVSDDSADLMEKSRLLLTQAVSLGDVAREQIFTAEKLKQEGERRIEDSKLLTQKAQFAAAKERLEQAAGKFDESLSYLEDPVLRKYRDEEIPRLYNEIQVAENNLVVRQVREYLTQGKSYYSQGNFPLAQSVLIKAQSRWSDTNIEPNPEVEYWLTLTQTALSVTSGREIAETDPLYSEMNQYLNQARSDFQSARDELGSGRTTEADVYFVRAEQSILYVQQFFPFNEEARVLNLRISQYRNPQQFNELFRTDFIDARNLISDNPQKAYIDLKDLEAINPNYSGLQAAITEAEYAAGIKVRPPDPAKLQRSTELYNLAYDIVSRNVRSEFSVALTYLNEAINLNPENESAIRLKDRISTDVGGTAVAVMSNADQQRYEEAVSEFTAGNYLKARIIVENLLQNADNQRNPKLIDLKERIERIR